MKRKWLEAELRTKIVDLPSQGFQLPDGGWALSSTFGIMRVLAKQPPPASGASFQSCPQCLNICGFSAPKSSLSKNPASLAHHSP